MLGLKLNHVSKRGHRRSDIPSLPSFYHSFVWSICLLTNYLWSCKALDSNIKDTDNVRPTMLPLIRMLTFWLHNCSPSCHWEIKFINYCFQLSLPIIGIKELRWWWHNCSSFVRLWVGEQFDTYTNNDTDTQGIGGWYILCSYIQFNTELNLSVYLNL